MPSIFCLQSIVLTFVIGMLNLTYALGEPLEGYRSEDLKEVVKDNIGKLQSDDAETRNESVMFFIELSHDSLLRWIATDKSVSNSTLTSMRATMAKERLGVRDVRWLCEAAIIWANRIEDPEVPGDTLRAKSSAGELCQLIAEILEVDAEDKGFESSPRGFHLHVTRLLERGVNHFEQAGDERSVLILKIIQYELNSQFEEEGGGRSN